MIYFYIVLAFILSYLLGSIPFGLIIGKLVKGIDIREHGSKSIGATNVARVIGYKWGFIAFLLDGLKGALPIIVIQYIIGAGFGNRSLFLINLPNGRILNIIILFSIAACVGHMASIFLKFKGGKAVATGAGMVFAFVPIWGLICFAVYLIILFTTRLSSLGSLIVTSMVGAYVWLDVYIFRWWLIGGPMEHIINLILISVLVVLIFYLHRRNIVRLFKGTENKLGQKKIEDTVSEEIPVEDSN